MSIAIANTEAAILSRALQPGQGDLAPEAARSLLRIHLSEPDHERATALAEKATDESLTGAEKQELECYRNVGRLLELMKSKARLSLQSAGAGS